MRSGGDRGDFPLPGSLRVTSRTQEVRRGAREHPVQDPPGPAAWWAPPPWAWPWSPQPSPCRRRAPAARATCASATTRAAPRPSRPAPHTHPAGTAPHSHHDPATKNLALPRRGDRCRHPGPDHRGRAAGRARRTSPGSGAPPTPADHRPGHRAAAPGTRRTATRWPAAATRLTAGGDADSSSKPTDLGRYLLYTAARRFVAAGGTAGEPGERHRLDGRASAAGRTTLRPTPAPRCAAAAARPSGSPAADGLPRLPGVPDRHHRRPARRRDAVPGGARVRRRPHPRHGLRVPRRRRALRQAVGPLRRAVRPGRLPRPLRDPGVRRRARGRAVRPPAPRPGRLADVQGLAGARTR